MLDKYRYLGCKWHFLNQITLAKITYKTKEQGVIFDAVTLELDVLYKIKTIIDDI